MAKRRYRVTEANIAKKLEEGRGTGTGSSFKPRLTIYDLSSHGRSTRIRGTTAGRVHHLHSDNERDAFLEYDWHEAVVDVREQFPLPRADTLAICAAMGVRHPQDQGIDIVMTTDLVIDIEDGAARRLVAVSVKPAGDLDDPRKIGKLEVERRYWAMQDVPWRLVTDRDTSKVRSASLMWLHEFRWLDLLKVPCPDYWRDRCDAVRAALATTIDDDVGTFLDGLDAAGNWNRGRRYRLFAISRPTGS